jgi:hypothetical protein
MKRLALLTIAVILAFTSFAQIQRKVFKCTLGTTTYNQVERILENNYKNPSFDGSRTYLTLENVEYGGYVWDTVTFNFYNKVLYTVCLKGSSFATKQDFSGLEADLRSRYSQYSTSEGYDDNIVVITTSFFENAQYDYKTAKVTYEYKPFTKKKHKENESAW